MISVIIPALNEEKYIASTIRSVRENSIEHEVIVVCNGCTDNTESVAKPLADKVIVLKERGVSNARNEGAKAAKYNILVFLDADTKMSSKVLEAISKTNGYGTCKPEAESGLRKDRVFFYLKYLTMVFKTSCGIIFTSRSIFNSVKGFEVGMTKFEDGIFMKRARKFGKYNVLKTPVYTSTRRYQKLGYVGTALFWFKEFFFPSDEVYEVVR